MSDMEFHICCEGTTHRWKVRLDDTQYGDYIDKDQAVLDAVDAANDARARGQEAHVWLREGSTERKIF